MMLDFILSLDKQLFVLINSHWTSAWADAFFPAVTDLHKTIFFKSILVPAILFIFMWRRGVAKGLTIFVFCLLAISTSDGVGNWAFKKTVQRPRPPQTQGLQVVVRAPSGGYSFVSNHATNMFTFASFVSAIFPAAAATTYGIAFIVSYSRVYNGVHFPTDVICGGLLGVFFGLLFSRLCFRVLARIDRQRMKT